MDVVATRNMDKYPEVGEAFAAIMGVSFVLSLASVLISLILFIQARAAKLTLTACTD